MSYLKYSFLFVFLAAATSAWAVQDFFPDTSQNLTKITWAHAVNNQSYLSETLKNGGINMIEADIVLGKLNGTGEDIPIMGHPPADTSDLSLENFLQQTKDYNDNAANATGKGVKLDFKTIEVFEASTDIVGKFNQSSFPIWLNADILPGPINASTTPVDATRFLVKAKSFPDSTLSIGWTTLYGSNYSGSYEASQIKSMIDTIQNNDVNQIITFPVRAGLAAQSRDLLVNLTAEIENSTLTIWSSEGDSVNVDDLRELIKTIGIEKTYVDVPSDLLNQLHLDTLSNSCMTKLAFTGYLLCLFVTFKNLFGRI